jgi:hypothetical protein
LGERCYDVLRNNCEHFCNWCQVGESRSTQVELLLQRMERMVRLILGTRGAASHVSS